MKSIILKLSVFALLSNQGAFAEQIQLIPTTLRGVTSGVLKGSDPKSSSSNMEFDSEGQKVPHSVRCKRTKKCADSTYDTV
ncbi:hypothetical protein ACHAWF_013436 [Thalassiosira exigua]